MPVRPREPAYDSRMSESEALPELVLVVAGTTLRAEQMDRPLAYYLQSQIEELGKEHDCPPPLVISDARYLHEKDLQQLPTISVGGPGVNLLAQKWLDELPSVLTVEEKFLVQMALDDPPPRACIWGMNNPLTKVAVVTFVERFLPRFLQACGVRRVEGET